MTSFKLRNVLATIVHIVFPPLRAGIEVTPEGDVFTLGQPASLSCTSDLRGAAVEWISLSEDDITPASVTGDGGSSLLQFASVSEDLHDRVYVCHVTTPYGSLEEEHRLTVSGEVMSCGGVRAGDVVR